MKTIATILALALASTTLAAAPAFAWGPMSKSEARQVLCKGDSKRRARASFVWHHLRDLTCYEQIDLVLEAQVYHEQYDRELIRSGPLRQKQSDPNLTEAQREALRIELARSSETASIYSCAAQIRTFFTRRQVSDPVAAATVDVRNNTCRGSRRIMTESEAKLSNKLYY